MSVTIAKVTDDELKEYKDILDKFINLNELSKMVCKEKRDWWTKTTQKYDMSMDEIPYMFDVNSGEFHIEYRQIPYPVANIYDAVYTCKAVFDVIMLNLSMYDPSIVKQNMMTLINVLKRIHDSFQAPFPYDGEQK